MEVVLIVTAALAAFLGGSWFFDGPQRRLRDLERVRRRLIGALHEGQRARIVGEVAAIGEPLIAPVTGRRCVLYMVEVDSIPSHAEVRRLVTEQRAVPFVLDDGSGRSVIDPTNAQLALDAGRRGEAGETHAGVTALLVKHQRGAGGHVRYHERILEVGAEVAVLGDPVREPDPDSLPAGTYRTDLAARLRMTNVVISNRPAARR